MSKLFKSPNSTVERFRNSRGQDVPIDSFLYACFEAENTIRAVNKDQPRNIQWPTLTDLRPDDLQQEIEAQELLDLFEDMMSWYSANFPELSSPLAWDYSLLGQVVPPLVSLASDLNTIHEKKTTTPLPEFDPEVDVQSSVWNLIRSLVDRLFSAKSNYIMRYLEWSFGKNKAEEIEPGSRPPVGRHSPNFQRGRGPGGGGGNRDRHGGGGGGGGRRHQGGGGDRNRHRDGGGGGDRNRDRGNYRGGDNRDRNQNRGGGGGHRRSQEANAELEAAALEECKQAMAHLESNPGEEKVTLRPQNSFYRRIQHQLIVSSGYHSESAGDGHDRSVVVWRAPKE